MRLELWMFLITGIVLFHMYTEGKYVKNIINHDGTATLLLHPLCMFLEDNFSFMIKLLSKLSKYN